MPINEKFLQQDPNSYKLSQDIDKQYDEIIKKLFPIKDLNNDRDLFELCHNYKLINKCYEYVKTNYMTYAPNKYDLNAFKECIIHNYNLKAIMVKNFCKDSILSDEAITNFLITLQEEMTLLNFLYNVDAMIDSGKKINFIFIFYRIENFHKFFNSNIYENANISIADKNFYYKNTLQNPQFYNYFKEKFLIYAEVNVYKKILQSPNFSAKLVSVKLVSTPKILMKQTIILCEAIDFFVKEAKDIFRHNSSDVVQKIYDLKAYIFKKLDLFDNSLTDLRKLEKLMLDVDISLSEAESVTEFKDIMMYVKQAFPNIRKNEFVTYVVNKLGQHLEITKENNFLTKMRYNNFVKEFNYNPENINEKTITIERKFTINENQEFTILESLAKYYTSRKRAFNIDESNVHES